jgi:hypothetical protein
LRSRHPEKQEDGSDHEFKATPKYDFIDKILVNQRLGEAEEGSEKDQNGSQEPLQPVSPDERPEGFEVGLDGSVISSIPQRIRGQFPGKTASYIRKPAIHAITHR